jgi:dihydroneopterin triphosphate diphosphatase
MIIVEFYGEKVLELLQKSTCIHGGRVMRAQYQVLVLPYRIVDNHVEYAIFNRADLNYWQGIAGGGEDDETPIEAARREAFEEASLTQVCRITPLDSVTSLPVEHVVGEFLWGEDVYIIKEYSFGIEVLEKELSLSKEHSACKWMSYEDALLTLKWDSNKTALWELNKRLTRNIDRRERNDVNRISNY